MFTVNYIVPPDDSYYTLLRGASCAPCIPPDTVAVYAAHVVLNFPVTCPVSVDFAVVAAVGDPGCRSPDPADVICPGGAAILTPSAPGTMNFDLPLSPDCRFAGEAFLRINFQSLPQECQEVATRPRLVTTDRCGNCEVYNFYGANRDDLCALKFPGRPVMYVDVASCVVPTVARSWGAVKVLYR